MSVLIHDSSVSGHRKWLLQTLRLGYAEGAVISPFTTPWISSKGNPSATQLIDDIRRRHPRARVLVDAETHGALLPGTDRLTHYNTWSLWPTRQRTLTSTVDIDRHINAVFAAQTALAVDPLAPTVTVDTPTGTAAATALTVARRATRTRPDTTLTIAGRTSFWRSGAALDAYIGQLARLRPAGWYILHIHDRSTYPPDLTDTDAVAGWLRTVHSLSLRTPVIAAATDYAGIAATAAGANTIGTGWHAHQRGTSIEDWQQRSGGTSPGWSPHPGLLARVRRADARTLRTVTPVFADSMRWDQPIPASDETDRQQHLAWIHEHHATVLASGSRPASRVPTARRILNGANLAWDYAVGLNTPELTASDKAKAITGLRDGFEQYALNQGL